MSAAAAPALASSPADSGTLTAKTVNAGTTTATWTGTLLQGTATAAGSCTANTDATNDHHAFTVAYPTLPAKSHVVTTVTNQATVADTILEVVDSAGVSKGVSDNGANAGLESLSFTDLAPGKYDAISCAYSGAGPYTGSVTLTTTVPDAGAVTSLGGTSDTANASTFGNYNLGTLANTGDAGEPSIGVDWKTGNVFFQGGLTTVKAVFPDYTATNQPKLTDVSCLNASLESLDPIMYTDSTFGRVQVSQLTGVDSASAYFDDPTSTATGPQTVSCTPSQGGGLPSGADHQTVGGGVYPTPLPTGVTGPLPGGDPHAVYYCSQEIVTAFCARSDDGGLTFGAGVPTYTTADGCGGLHGHVRVGPEGNVYLPNKGCNGVASLAVSTDAGTTWKLYPVTGSSAGAGDPSVSADSTGKLYFTWQGSDGAPGVATSTDFGKTWTNLVRPGDVFGIQQSDFPEVTAGGPGRAAVAFLGSKLSGPSGSDPTYGVNGNSYTGGDFHLYVGITVDGGKTYRTVDVTPNDPVQRGEICTAGTTCTGSTRNLLDFNDITVDKTGHVLVGYSDGCTAACVTSTATADNTFTSQGYIARQIDGPLLFASAADVTPTLPETRTPVVLLLLAMSLAFGAFGWRRLRAGRLS